MEHFFRRARGVVSTTVGYTGGQKENPTYEEVYVHSTGHAEAVEVTYDPSVTSYEEVTRLFFEIHDPTQVDRQGSDVGSQYRSEIFYFNDRQKAIAERLIQEMISKGYKVVTKVTKATEFWKAEEYHQDYYAKTGNLPYCHQYTKRF